jgi:hypothetical protein
MTVPKEMSTALAVCALSVLILPPCIDWWGKELRECMRSRMIPFSDVREGTIDWPRTVPPVVSISDRSVSPCAVSGAVAALDGLTSAWKDAQKRGIPVSWDLVLGTLKDTRKALLERYGGKS